MFKIKKTTKTSDFKKKPRCRAFYGVIFSVILFLGLFNGFLTKNAFASNNYVDDVKFYGATSGPFSGYAVVSFHVKTTFTIYTYDIGCQTNMCKEGLVSSNAGGSLALGNQCYPNGFVFTAGNNYVFPLVNHYYSGSCGSHWGYRYDVNWDWVPASTLNSSHYIENLFGYDIGRVYFKQFPILTITYPHDNDEIAGAFYVQGSYTIPASSTYYALLAGFFPVGTYDPHNFNRNVGAFNADIAPPSGNFSIPNWQLPAGYYDIHFRFIGIGEQYDAPEYISNIHLLNDIPPSLPTGETPPTIPVYPETSPEAYHASYCSYGTSTTPLFNTLTGAIGGLITNIGQSLADFADRFNLTDAQNTGQQLANSVLLMRSYVATLNSFFGDLPVSQILILYLIVFVLVILFRLIKSLINLIKP